MPATLILVKHAQPVLDAAVPPREWRLASQGVEQSRALARRLKGELPFVLVCSTEPKAVATARIVCTELGLEPHVLGGLEEIDRRSTPIMAPDEYDRYNARLFAARSTPIVGNESADAALARFSAAIHRARAAHPSERLVVIAHGTVISLFAEQHTGQNALDTWRSLQCADSLTVLLP